MNSIGKLRFLYRAWGYRLRQERREIGMVRKHLAAGDTAVDVGAHKGAYTWWMSRTVGDNGRVFAFEPQPELSDYLVEAKQALRLNRLEVVPAAVSATPGKLKLYRPQGEVTPGATLLPKVHGQDGRAVNVAVESLDHFFRSRVGRPIRLIKCDAEGHELDVFRGARQILAEDRPLLLFEAVEFLSAGGVQPVFDLLHQFGYDGYFFGRAGLKPVGDLTPQHLNSSSRNFVYNFVFVHRQKTSQLRRAA